MSKIKIVIADDHSLMRQGLEQLLSLNASFQVIGLAVNGQDALHQCVTLMPDVLLLDINMPLLNGIQTLRRIKDMGLKTKVIMLTIHDDKEYLMETLNIGAQGYMLKDADSDSLSTAIKVVHQGGTYIQPTLANYLVADFKANNHVQQQVLTRRELEVISLIAEGLNNKEIADTLYISEKTVKNHVSNIFKKIDVSDRTQAAIYAFKQNIKKI